MGRIFISAGYAGGEPLAHKFGQEFEYGSAHGLGQESARIPGGISEVRDLILTRDLVVTELRSRGFEVLSVPEELGADQIVDWINQRDRPGDIALEMQTATHISTSVRGTSVYYIACNSDRKQHAELLLLALTRRVPQLLIRGVSPDTHTQLGLLGFCRQLIMPSLYLQLGFLTNSDDRFLMQNRRQEIALGIADGLAAWSRMVTGHPVSQASSPPAPMESSSPGASSTGPFSTGPSFTRSSSTGSSSTGPFPAGPSYGNPATGSSFASPFTGSSSPGPSSHPPMSPSSNYTSININLNGRIYGEQGIFVNGNPCISIDLVDRLGIRLSHSPQSRRFVYGHVVYIKAIDLREFDIAVNWDNSSRTVSIRSILPIGRQLHAVIGKGYTSEVQMLMFLKAHNEAGIAQFPDIARLYRDEAIQEGVNHDLAFAQMCLETDFLRFWGTHQPSQNNFGGLGLMRNGQAGATFPSVRIGVRAHIQHLKAYASTEPLREEVVDPRFNCINRGIAPLLEDLSGRWAPDLDYGNRILALMRLLYESSGFL